MTGTGILKAFDFDGKELWMRDIQKDYGRFGLKWGYGSSPLLLRGLAVRAGAARHEDRRSLLRPAHRQGDRQDDLARRAADQRARESPDCLHHAGAAAARQATPSSSSPAATSVTGHDLATGKELWRADGTEPDERRRVPHRRVAGRARRAASSRRPASGRCWRCEPGGRGDVTRSHVMWSFDNGPDVPTPVTDGTYFYVVNDRGIMWCLDAKTGKKSTARSGCAEHLQRLVHPGRREALHHERGRADDGPADGAEVRDTRREQLRRLHAELAGGFGGADLHPHHRRAVGDRKAHNEKWKTVISVN